MGVYNSQNFSHCTLLRAIHLEVKVNVSSHLRLCESESMDYIIYGILEARILEWVAFPFSRESSQPRD